jgi:hypothetical protein
MALYVTVNQTVAIAYFEYILKINGKIFGGSNIFPYLYSRKRKSCGRNRRGKDNPLLQVTLIVNKMLTDINRVENIWRFGCQVISLYHHS